MLCHYGYSFCHFFVSPLLAQSSVEREIEAVDSGKCSFVAAMVMLLWYINRVSFGQSSRQL